MTDRLPEDAAFTRLVCPIEQWFLGFPAKMSPVTNFCVEGAGRLDAESLRRAVAVASEACPGARLVRRGRRWVDGGADPAVKVVSGVADPCAAPELRSPLPNRSGANCEVLLLDGPEPTVVLRASHVVMDGRGLILWARDVFRALRGEEPAGARSTGTVLDLDNPFYSRAGQAEAATKVPSLLGIPPRADIRRQLWRRRTVDGNFPALSAKLAAAVTAFSGRSTAPIRFPLDLRPFHPEIRSTGNLSLVLSLDVAAADSWEEIYQRLLAALSDQDGRVSAPDPSILKAPVPLLRYFIRRAERSARREDRFSATANVNNLGRVPAEWFHTGTFEAAGAYMVSPMEPATPVSVVATEGNGRTDLTVAWWDGPGMSERVDALLDTVGEALAPAVHREQGRLTSAALPDPGPGIVDRFLEQVRRRPDAIAVSASDGEVTYAELDRRMRGVAKSLRELGVGREDVVGLLADKTVDAVAGAWGTLMAGAAYLPMDPQHPDARIRTLLADAKAAACLVTRPHDRRDHRPDGCAGLVLDDLPRDADLEPAAPAPGDLAYVVYTSGSTGRPKGVEVEHRSIAAYATCATKEHGIGPATRLPLLCSLSFDLAQLSLILPLTVGGTLQLLRDEISHLGLQEVLDAGATTLSLTPSHLDLITRLELRPGAVRTLLVIGEQFTRGVALRARQVFGPDCLITNMYGPAEATIGVGYHDFDADRDEGAAVPIGVPYDGVTYHVLDAGRGYVAPGEPGELYIGGSQLARGYRGRPDLTRERFVRLADGSRVYRTGDIVRRLPGGGLEFCGRIDDQLKVLGHRIEPAEIAQTMETHPAVSGAVVVARSRPGARDKTLCGYVTAADGPIDIGELTGYLAEQLPGYLVPATIVPVAEFPRSMNGKIATASLPDPFGAAKPVAGGALEGMEDTVARIWSQVLGVEVDRLHGASDFHRLGGDSLSLITMVAQVARHATGPDGERAFVSRLPEIIRRTTVEHVAELAVQARAGQ
ncbi:amino acid adenylation domain-containing protein [Amycolatopsis sp. NPDC026612]|uniref:amino acid adenylation domain-containing protein n=1 Tax=Amycolatopsis sp. NPDC026612 TaxID=3155466 RepID=UPI0033C95AA7